MKVEFEIPEHKDNQHKLERKGKGMKEREYYIKVGNKWHPVTHWNKDTGLPEEVSPIGFTTEEVKSRECHFIMTGSYEDKTIKPFLDLLRP